MKTCTIGSIAILILVFIATNVNGQSSSGINYQASLRDDKGEILVNSDIGVRFTILLDSDSELYQETYDATTTSQGLINLVIGQGTASSGSFSAIDWGAGSHRLKVEINQGSGFIEVGTMEMVNVPYSYYSERSGSSDWAGLSNVPEGFADNVDNNTQLNESEVEDFITNNGLDLNSNTTLAGAVISTGDHTTTIDWTAVTNKPDLVTPDPTDEIQDLQISDNNLVITNNTNATNIDLSSYLDNTDGQTLTLNGSELSIEDGNSVDLGALGVADPLDEIQDLSLSGNTLTITNNVSATNIDLSPYLDNTDTQLDETEVDAFVANNGYLSSEVDGSITNEIQDLSLTSNTLIITNNASATGIDLSSYLDNTDTQLDAAGITALGFVSGAHTVDTDTQLDETAVDVFVANNGYLTTEVDGDVTNEIELPTGGTTGQVLKTDGSGNYTWVNQTTDTQLDAAGVTALGFASGAHTVDTDTQLDAAGVTALGFVSGAHTVDTDTQLDAAGITALGFTSGAHTVDTDTQLDAAGVTALGFTSGAHTVDTDTQLDAAGITALGFTSGAHTVDTDTQLDETAVDAFVANNGYLTTEVDGSVTNEIELPTTANAGDMSYWDGTAWIVVAATQNEGATLQMISGVPTWIGGSPPAVGDFRYGGVVFWIDGKGGGLVCAVSDQSTAIQWNNGSFTTTGATGYNIGTGQANTTAIVANQGVGSYAAQLSNDLVLNGYSDWFLPSPRELYEMYLNKVAIDAALLANGGVAIATTWYWSSMEDKTDVINAYMHNFVDGSEFPISKNVARSVRSVRAF